MGTKICIGGSLDCEPVDYEEHKYGFETLKDSPLVYMYDSATDSFRLEEDVWSGPKPMVDGPLEGEFREWSIGNRLGAKRVGDVVHRYRYDLDAQVWRFVETVPDAIHEAEEAMNGDFYV